MKIKTSELKDTALDWAVAKCEGREVKRQLTAEEKDAEDIPVFFDVYEIFRPSTDWSHGGPIIEREKIWVSHAPIGMGSEWCAIAFPYDVSGVEAFSPTPLIAAMRCYCCAKLGDYVDIPEELCQQQNS